LDKNKNGKIDFSNLPKKRLLNKGIKLLKSLMNIKKVLYENLLITDLIGKSIKQRVKILFNFKQLLSLGVYLKWLIKRKLMGILNIY
jgi:hypothetical protein